MFNIFKSKKFDITIARQYKALQDEFERLRLKYNDLKEDNVSFQLLPASIYDDAGNEYFLQLRSDRTECRISYQAKPGPLELFKAYGDTIPQAIENLYKLGILNHVSRSILRNPESEYELRSVKDYIDSFLSSKGPESEDDLINIGLKYDLNSQKETEEGTSFTVEMQELPKQTITTTVLSKEDFVKRYGHLDVPRYENKGEINISRKDFLNAMVYDGELQKQKLMIHPKDLRNALKAKEKDFRKKYSKKIKNI